MNITFLIGNGFDLNLKLETSYGEFYKYYQSLTKPDTAEIVVELKKSINDFIKSQNDDSSDENVDLDKINWSDLEIGIGQYTSKINSLNEFNILFKDIKKGLVQFLQEKENQYLFTNSLNKEKLINHLINPEQFLNPNQDQIIKNFRGRFAAPHNINVITFNYTKVLEKILGFTNKSIELNKETKINNIFHVHGSTDKSMILGVNDHSQIANQQLKSDILLTTSLIKPLLNENLGQLIVNQCNYSINHSQIIVLFGLSFGDTDKYWWELIGKQFKREDFQLILFTKSSEDLTDEFDHYIIQKTIEVKENFFRKAKLNDELNAKASSRTFVALNSEIFKVILEKRVVTVHLQ